MASNTAIEWCDSTLNPWIGCQKVGPGCDSCYAEALMDKRYGKVEWGAGKDRVRTSAANWKLPVRWNAQPFVECIGCRWRGQAISKSVIDTVLCPQCRRDALQPARRRVFCASLADVFDNEVPLEWFVDLLDLIRRTPNLDWLLLTKRIGNLGRIVNAALTASVNNEALRAWIVDWWSNGSPPPNVWLGATICNQEEADRDVPKLLAAPARVRFLSVEPMLSPVILSSLDDDKQDRRIFLGFSGYGREVHGVDWVICGGESGLGARPMHPNWVRSLRDQCAGADVPFLFKQWGEWGPTWVEAHSHMGPRAPIDPAGNHSIAGTRLVVARYTGGSEREALWPVVRVGKAAAGRDLDGVVHNGFPS